MSDDAVEIIENCPEIIEISDEEDEENRDIIEIHYEDTGDLVQDNNDIFIRIKEENAATLDQTMTTTNVEAPNGSLLFPETQNNTKIPTVGRQRKRKKRQRSRRRKLNTTTNGVTAVNLTDSPNKLAKNDTCSISNATEPCIQIIKQENETPTSTSIPGTEANLVCTNTNNTINNNNDLQNETTDTSPTAVSQTENPSSRPINSDFSKLSWLKPLKNLSSPPHLQLVIIDRGHPDWKIENDKWLMIEKRLLETLHSEILRTNDSSIGLFDGAKWQRGIKIVGCHNKKALNFVKNFIFKLDKLWAGAKLDVCTMANFVRKICKVFVPPPILATDVVLSLIKLQNPTICSEDWEVLGEQERNQGIDMWLSISEESYTHLRSLRGEIKFGINRIFVNPVLKQNQTIFPFPT